MRVLILNQYFPPDTSSTAEIVELVADNISARHQVSVIAGRPSYAPSKKHPYYILRKERVRKVSVERVGSTAFDRANMLGRLTNTFLYLLFALIRAALIRPKPDIIVAMSDPPLASIVGALVSLTRRCSFVYNIRDLHPDMAIEAGMIESGLLTRIWEKLHRWTISRAHLVIVLGEDMKSRVVTKGFPKAKVLVNRACAAVSEELLYPNGANGDNSVHELRREIRNHYEFVVLHAGNLGYAGNWDVLLKAAKLVDPERVSLVFVGAGSQLNHLIGRSEDINNVRFLPYYSRDLVPYVLRSADLHIVAVRSGLEGLVVPSKVYPILMAGRPVLAVSSPNSDSAQIVTKYQCGFVANPDSPDDVAAMIDQAMRDRVELERMGERARMAGLEFSQEREMTRMVHLLETVVSDN